MVEEEPVYVQIGDDAVPILPQKRMAPTAPATPYYIPVREVRQVERRRRCRSCACGYVGVTVLLLLLVGLMTGFFISPRVPSVTLTHILVESKAATAEFEVLNFNYYSMRFYDLEVHMKHGDADYGYVEWAGPLEIMARERQVIRSAIKLTPAGEEALQQSCGSGGGDYHQSFEVSITGSIKLHLGDDCPLSKDFGSVPVKTPYESFAC